jgi:hypothetical protein
MKKLIAAAVAAAFSLSIAGTAIAAPAQVNQRHSQSVEVQAEKPATQKSKKKKVAKKSTKKKQTAKKKAPKTAA